MMIPAIKLTFDLKQAVALAVESLGAAGNSAHRHRVELSELDPPLRPALLFHKDNGVYLTSTSDTSALLPVYANGFGPADRWQPVWADHGLSEQVLSLRIDLLADGLLTHLRDAAADLHSLLCITYTDGFAPRVTHPHRGPGTDEHVSDCCPPF